MKKSWHPGTFKNIERVWKREKEQEEESRKVDQWRKEKEEERRREELQQVAEAAGKVKCVVLRVSWCLGKNSRVAVVHGGRRKGDRLEWMYAAGGQGTGGVVDDEREAFLLGKRRVDKLVAKEAATEESSFAKTQVAFYGVTANSARDLQNKVREDPLLAIKYAVSLRVSVVNLTSVENESKCLSSPSWQIQFNSRN